MATMINALRLVCIIIGIFDSIVSGIALLLLLLGSTHAQHVTQLVDEDAWNVAHDATLPRANNNVVRMRQGQQLAYVTLESVRLLIFMMTFHLVSGLCLLYGAVKRQREVMTLWLGSTAGLLMFGAGVAALLVYCGSGNVVLLAAAAAAAQLYICLWYVVFRFHRLLARDDRCVAHDVTVLPDKQAGPIGKPQYV